MFFHLIFVLDLKDLQFEFCNFEKHNHNVQKQALLYTCAKGHSSEKSDWSMINKHTRLTGSNWKHVL